MFWEGGEYDLKTRQAGHTDWILARTGRKKHNFEDTKVDSDKKWRRSTALHLSENCSVEGFLLSTGIEPNPGPGPYRDDLEDKSATRGEEKENDEEKEPKYRPERQRDQHDEEMWRGKTEDMAIVFTGRKEAKEEDKIRARSIQ